MNWFWEQGKWIIFVPLRQKAKAEAIVRNQETRVRRKNFEILI